MYKYKRISVGPSYRTMERPERPSRHKSSSRLRNQSRRYHLFSDTDSDMEVETGTVNGDIRRFSPILCSGLLGSSNMSVGEPSTSNTVSSLMPDTQLLVEPDRTPPGQPLSLHEVDNSRELLNVSRRKRLALHSAQFTLPNHDNLMQPAHNSTGTSVDSSIERPVSYRSGFVTANNNICYLPAAPVTKRYRTSNGPSVSSDIIDGPSTSRLSGVPEQPNSAISEADIGMLQVGSDTEGEPPVEPSNQYSRRRLGFASSCEYWENPQNTVEPINLTARSPPYRELQNQAESEFLRRLDEITFDNSARVRLTARRRIVSPSLSHETLDQDTRSDQEPPPVPVSLPCGIISNLRQGGYAPFYPLNHEGDESSRDTENVHNVEAPEVPESGRQSGDIIILSTPEQQSPPPDVLPSQMLPASPPPQSPAEQGPTLPSSEQRYPSPQSPSRRGPPPPPATSGERCPPPQSPTRHMMTPSEQFTPVSQNQRAVPVTPAQRCPPVNSNANSLATSSGSSEQKDEAKDSSINNFQELNHNLVSILECPVCLDFMVPPIYQCSKGHIVCMTCRPKLILCPTCRARFADRNLAMEKVAERLMYPCKNVVTGCTVTLRLKDKTAHEESCGFRHYQCISAHCQWKGYKPELVVHMMISHRDKLIVGINQVVSVSLCPVGGRYNWILSALNEVFQVSFLTDISEKLLVGTVYYVGPPEKASKFYYTFCIKHHMDPYNSIEYTHRTHIDTLKASSLISSHDCFNITLDVARTYRTSRSSNELPIVVGVHEIP